AFNVAPIFALRSGRTALARRIAATRSAFAGFSYQRRIPATRFARAAGENNAALSRSLLIGSAQRRRIASACFARASGLFLFVPRSVPPTGPPCRSYWQFAHTKQRLKGS